MKKIITTILLALASTATAQEYYSTPNLDTLGGIYLITTETSFSMTSPACYAPRSFRVNPKWRNQYMPQMKHMHYGFKNRLLIKEEAERIREEASLIAKRNNTKIIMSPEIPRDNDSAITFGSLFLQAARSEHKNIFMQYFPGVSSSSEWADFEIHRDKNLLLPNNTTKGLALLEKTGKRLFLYSEYFKIPASLEDHPLVYVITSPSSKNPWLVPQAEWTSVDGRTMNAAYIGERKINPGHLSSTKKIEWAYFWKNERLHSVPMKNLSEESRNKIRGTEERRNENTSNNLASN